MKLVSINSDILFDYPDYLTCSNVWKQTYIARNLGRYLLLNAYATWNAFKSHED